MRRPTRKSGGKRERRRKICRFCENRVRHIEMFDIELLRKFQTENGKILPKRATGTCPQHQKMLGKAIKRARILSLAM